MSVRPCRRLCGWLALIVNLLLGCPSGVSAQQRTLAAQGPLQIPLIYDALTSPYPVIQLRINGISLPFILDTGTSGQVVIEPWAAEQLHLISSEQNVQIGTKMEQAVDLKRVEVAGKSLVTDRAGFIPFSIRDSSIADLGLPAEFSAFHIAGLVGLSFFRSWTVQFDFARQTLTLLPPTEKRLKVKRAITLPLKRVDTRVAITAKSSTGKSVDLLVDTGAHWFVAQATVVQQFPLLPSPPILEGSWGVSGSQLNKLVLIGSFQLGSLTEPNVTAMIRNEGHSLIGMDFLSRFRMTIDLKHQEMLLERSANYAQRVRLSGLPSILVAKQQGEYVVYDVLPSSAAAQAGIHAGDTIEQVDGQILSQFSAGAAQDILNGYAETKAEIVVKGSGRKTIHYTRQSLFAMPHGRQAGIGIGVTISEKGTLMIETVDNYSPAQEAGLKVGDQIKAINGLPVSTTPFDRLAAEMTKPAGTTVVLQVIHSGSDKPEEFKLVIRRLL